MRELGKKCERDLTEDEIAIGQYLALPGVPAMAYAIAHECARYADEKVAEEKAKREKLSLWRKIKGLFAAP